MRRPQLWTIVLWIFVLALIVLGVRTHAHFHFFSGAGMLVAAAVLTASAVERTFLTQFAERLLIGSIGLLIYTLGMVLLGR